LCLYFPAHFVLYIVFLYCCITWNFCGGSVHIVTRLRIVQAGGEVLFRQRPEGFWCPPVCLTNAAGTLSVELQQLKREDRCSYPSRVENNNSRNNASALSHMVLIASQRQIFFASIFFWSQVTCPLLTLRYSTLFPFVLSSVWVSFFHLLLYL
jgi:hypothetical protein